MVREYREIGMIDLPSEYQRQKEEIDVAIQEVLHRGDFIKGKSVQEFEQKFAEYLGVTSVISCGNGTDAIQIALMALGIGKGDEVILPAFSYAAAIEMVMLLGATPVLVDVDPLYFQINTACLQELVTSNTKAIIVVHLYGQCADLNNISIFAKANNLFLIEDCAQCTGAAFKGQQLGTFGDIACTSFFPTKNLACYGDGGALYTNNAELADKARMIAAHGQPKKYDHQLPGINSRLDTIQAAILNVKLNYLDYTLQIKNNCATRYNKLLEAITQIEIPKIYPDVKHSWHQYTILVKDGTRDELRNYLKEKGISSMVHYPKVLNEHPAFAHVGGEFSSSKMLTKEILCLPVHSGLTNEDIMYICDSIKSFYVR